MQYVSSATGASPAGLRTKSYANLATLTFSLQARTISSDKLATLVSNSLDDVASGGEDIAGASCCVSSAGADADSPI